MPRLFWFLALTTFALNAQSVAVTPSPPQVAASAYLLMDATSGSVLVEHNSNAVLPPASLTKMMTSYVLSAEISAGRVKRDDLVVVSENAWSQNPVFAGSSLMWIEPGKDVHVKDLQRGLVISSGNDAAVAIAEHVAGSESNFADLMNRYAHDLGLSNTFFVNSHGLPHPDHTTTANDLATLAQALISQFPADYAIYKEREFTYNNIRQYNRNTLLKEDPSVDGIKTGHTLEAGYSLVASAEKQGLRLISVVLGAQSANSRKNESRKLLNYGFRYFETSSIIEASQKIRNTRIWKGRQDCLSLGASEQVYLTLPRGHKENLETAIEVDHFIEAPISQGQRLGSIKLILNGEIMSRVPLVALESVDTGKIFVQLWDSLLMWIFKLFDNSAGSALCEV